MKNPIQNTRGIRARWAINTLLPVIVILITVSAVLCAAVSEYYNGIMLSRVINNAEHKTTITDRNAQQQCVARAKQAKYHPGKEELRIIIFS